MIQALFGLVVYYSFVNMQDRGTFGDMFGVVNTLFSGLAFAGVIYAILLQRKELELQRKELEMTREELARSTVAQQKSSGVLAEQLSIMKESHSFQVQREQIKAQPVLKFNGGYLGPNEIEWNFVNVGATIKDVVAIPNGDFSVTIPKVLETDHPYTVTINYDSNKMVS